MNGIFVSNQRERTSTDDLNDTKFPTPSVHEMAEIFKVFFKSCRKENA